MTQGQQNTDTDDSNQPPKLSIDWELYGQYLEESDLNDTQKKELIETLWSIVVTFVDLGFGIEPTQQAMDAGKLQKTLAQEFDAARQGKDKKQTIRKGAGHAARFSTSP